MAGLENPIKDALGRHREASVPAVGHSCQLLARWESSWPGRVLWRSIWNRNDSPATTGAGLRSNRGRAEHSDGEKKMSGIQNRLAAILAADIASYSRLMHQDENATVTAWRDAREQIIKPLIADYTGRIVKHTGDGFLAEFPTVSQAVNCAVAMQERFSEFNAEKPEIQRMNFRMGINFGEIAVDDDDIHGDGVNIAARLESLADAPGICVTSHVYEQTRRKVACDFEDLGQHQVKNIDAPIHVYRIIAPAPEALAEPNMPAEAGAPAAANEITLPSSNTGPDKISIAVLPFVNMSTDPEQEFFVDGLTEDILTELARFSELFVISRNSTFTYKGQATKVMDVARDLDVRYVVEGSVRKAGNRIRVSVQLIDGTDDRHVWAERYDRDLEDIFEIQDEITAAITATLPGRLEADTHDRARRKPTDNLQAYECVLAGKTLHHRSEREANAAAMELLERAIELDPNYAHARAWRACVMGQAWTYGWGEPTEEAIDTAVKELNDPNLSDENDADVHRILAAICIARSQFDRALQHQEKALRRNPNYDLVVVQQGELLTWLGQAEEGIEWIERAMKLNPFHPQRFWSHLARAYFVAERYAESAESLKRLTDPDADAHAYFAASYAGLDDLTQAQAHAQEAMTLNPEFTVEANLTRQHFAREADTTRYQELLSRAGLS